MSQHKPQFIMTDKIHRLKAQIIKQEKDRLNARGSIHASRQMYHDSRIRNVHSTLAMENSSLTLAQVTDVIDGKHAPGTPDEIREVKNAYEAYSLMLTVNPIDPYSIAEMLHAHRAFMAGLAKEVGCFRSGEVVAAGQKRETAPLAKLVPRHMDNLVDWAKTSDEHPLIKSCVFHYELMSIHPFGDGNGHVARMWQMLLLSQRNFISKRLPVMDVVRERQQEYYDVLAISDRAAGSAKFTEYMLQAIKDALTEFG